MLAEAGVNHNGSIDRARELIDTAVAAGADAVKFQLFKADRLSAASAPKAAYQLETTDPGERQIDMLRRLELSVEALATLQEHCRRRGIGFLVSPFDQDSADALLTLGVEAFKIPSGELTNLAFLAHVARKGRPMIVSTGMARIGEVEMAIDAINGADNHEIVLLHCTSSYPAEAAEANLLALKTLRRAFGVPVGYSDHTLGIEVSLAAVALGACLIERHFTLDRHLPGPDHKASLEPQELKALVTGVRRVESALGDGRKEPRPDELRTAIAARRSLVAACDLEAGTELADAHVAIRRPGTGLPPSYKPFIIGRRLARSLSQGDLILLEHFR